MRVTLKDVAKQAGVSHKTVSRVVNNQGEISEATRQRVLQVIDQLEYRPNRLARGLITGKTQTLGVIIPDITDPFFPELILCAEKLARQHGYNVFLCNANRDPALELEYIRLLSERRVDGLMIAGSMLDESGLQRATAEHKTVILTPYLVPGAVVFTLDDLEGGHQIGRYLIERHHTRIGFIEASWRFSANRRRAGLLQALCNAGLPAENLVVEPVSSVSIENGTCAALSLLGRDPSISALVGYNDVLALGALEACRELGKQVPTDLSLVGIDDTPEASRSQPPLTSYRFDRRELGTAMMQQLLGLLENRDTGGQRFMVPGRLIERGTSC